MFFIYSWGVQPGDKVILCGETTGEYVLSALSVLLVGGIVVGVHTGFLPSQIETIVNHVPYSFFLFFPDALMLTNVL